MKSLEGEEVRADVAVHLAAAARRQVQFERKVRSQRLRLRQAARATVSAGRGMGLYLVRIGDASE